MLERARVAVKARTSLLDFMLLTMPDMAAPDDPTRSLYQMTPQARLLAEVLERVERGELKRVCVSMPPQMGKSQIISRGFPAWYMGRNPHEHFILGTYNQDWAEDFGGDIREIATAPYFKQVFPRFEFRQGSAAKDSLVTMAGGKMALAGRGSSLTGRPGTCVILDDILKDDKEAQSPTIRRDAWIWFNRVVMSRIHVNSAVVIVGTRWSEDDVIGRLVDPSHPEHDPEIARNWTYINLPAVVKSPELAAALGLTLEATADPVIIGQFGSAPLAALWPEKKPLGFLAEIKRLDPRGFESLYMGNPTPEDGEYFKRDWLVGYKPEELPRNLMKYTASDHAISEENHSDKSCFITVGVDEHGIIWVLPDLYWEKEADTNTIVDVMLETMRIHKPMIWWSEKENISRSILPFLRKRMIETNTMQTLVDDSMIPSVKKKVRAKSIQGMMGLKRVRFPTFAHWWPDAQNELLKFDAGAHDDFVDALAYIGMGLMREIPASKEQPADSKVIRVGSMAWIKGRSKWEERQAVRQKALKGM